MRGLRGPRHERKVRFERRPSWRYQPGMRVIQYAPCPAHRGKAAASRKWLRVLVGDLALRCHSGKAHVSGMAKTG
jgi:hypothetical protein